MTIVEKVIGILEAEGSATLSKIYAALPEHTKASIRGNINRYIMTPDAKIRRIDKGVYSVIKIIKVDTLDEEKVKVSFAASYYAANKQIHFFHKDYVTDKKLKPGTYQRMDDFDSFEEMENDINSVKSILIQDNAIEALKKLKSESFSLILTDPPYKVISGGTGGKDAPGGMLSKNDGKIFDHNEIHFSDYMGELYRVLKPDSHAYFFTNFLNLEELMQEVKKVGFKIHNLLVWKKNNCTPNRWYMKNCEYVLFCRKGKAKAINDKGCQTVHDFDNIIGDKIHETEKPLDLLRMYIKNSSDENDWILDPFAGSGSTCVAAMLENRKCTTIEIDDKYIPRIFNRVCNLLSTGTDFRNTQLA